MIQNGDKCTWHRCGGDCSAFYQAKSKTNVILTSMGSMGISKKNMFVTSEHSEKVLKISGAVSISSLLTFTSFQLPLGRFHVSFQHAKTSSSFTFSDPWISVFSRSSVVFVGSFSRRLSTRFCVSSCMVSRAQKKRWVFWCLFVSLLSLQSGSKYVNPLHFIQIYVFLKKSQLNATQFKMADSPPGYLITYSILSTTTDFWVRWIFPNFPL